MVQLPTDNILSSPVIVWALISVMGIALAVIGYLIKYLVGDFKKTLDKVQGTLRDVASALSEVTTSQKVMQAQFKNEIHSTEELGNRVDSLETEHRTLSERITIVETRCESQHKQ